MKTLMRFIREQSQKGLYVNRPLVNGNEFHQWVVDNRIPNPTPANEMHVTQVYSRKPIRLTPHTDHLQIGSGITRHFEIFGHNNNKALVLRFDHDKLHHRFKQTMEAGASYDYPEYKPHITLSYDIGKFDHTKLIPPSMVMHFGPEVHKPLDEDWEPTKK